MNDNSAWRLLSVIEALRVLGDDGGDHLADLRLHLVIGTWAVLLHDNGAFRVLPAERARRVLRGPVPPTPDERTGRAWQLPSIVAQLRMAAANEAGRAALPGFRTS